MFRRKLGEKKEMPNEKNGSPIHQVTTAAAASANKKINANAKSGVKIRILILTESFHPYTSGIARRFKEIIERLVQQNFLIHVVTGCKVILEFLTLYK